MDFLCKYIDLVLWYICSITFIIIFFIFDNKKKKAYNNSKKRLKLLNDNALLNKIFHNNAEKISLDYKEKILKKMYKIYFNTTNDINKLFRYILILQGIYISIFTFLIYNKFDALIIYSTAMLLIISFIILDILSNKLNIMNNSILFIFAIEKNIGVNVLNFSFKGIFNTSFMNNHTEYKILIICSAIFWIIISILLHQDKNNLISTIAFIQIYILFIKLTRSETKRYNSILSSDSYEID